MADPVAAMLHGLDALLRLVAAVGWCGEVRGFLKYGGSYWHRKRRIDRWTAERETK